MVTIEYSSEGLCISDFMADKFAELVSRMATSGVAWTTNVSSEIAILSVRAAISRGEIPNNLVIIRYGDEDIPIDRHGRIDKYPPGFCDKYDQYLEDILGVVRGGLPARIM